MSAAILVVLPESHHARAAFAKIAPPLTSSRISKSIYSILEAESPSVLSQIITVAERFGFSSGPARGTSASSLAANDHCSA